MTNRVVRNTNLSSPEHALFNADNFRELCDVLATKDVALEDIIATYGYPPMWTRKNEFETIVHIILDMIDLKTMTDLRCVNTAMRTHVDYFPLYTKIINHCPDALRALIPTQMEYIHVLVRVVTR